MSSDEFDADDFSEFTDQDFRDIDAHVARAHLLQQNSPLNTFLSWKKHIAVTDIVSPIWCEVQYEYSLYGKRNKPPHLRPSSFLSRSGKEIRVHHQVAQANNRRLQRGKSVHKALEQQLRPTQSLVHVISEEERFGLRLVQLIDGFTQLTTDGITRELPVFIITHGQVVTGVIDEVLFYPAAQDQGPLSTSCASPPHKKKRLSSSVSQCLASPDSTNDLSRAELACSTDNPRELRIIDYKTRRSPTIPVEEDSLSPRLQLMMYHRMLSSLLNPEAIDFDLLWTRLNLDPTKPFSAQFVKDISWEQRQVDPSECTVHLDRLVSKWISIVQRKRPEIAGVSRQLQLVYRRPEFVENDQGNKPAELDIEDPLEALLLQEDLDLSRAIEESLSKMGHHEIGQVAHDVAQNVKLVGPTSIGRTSAIWKDLVSPVSGQTDPAMAWAIQDSLLACAHKARAEVPAKQGGLTHDETRSVVAEQTRDNIVEMSPIIGRREFNMDDAELDAHVADVLQWWLGARPPKGVNVGQTNRCFTCEYQASCEWREQKAKEAAAVAAARRTPSNRVWPTTRPEGEIV